MPTHDFGHLAPVGVPRFRRFETPHVFMSVNGHRNEGRPTHGRHISSFAAWRSFYSSCYSLYQLCAAILCELIYY